jgi:hypothetical protein
LTFSFDKEKQNKMIRLHVDDKYQTLYKAIVFIKETYIGILQHDEKIFSLALWS